MKERRHTERNRRSIRLKGYDYSSPGAYFVTIVTQARLCMFGDVVEDKMCLNDAGAMAKAVWEALPRRFPAVEIDELVIMPNHIHAIITINEPDATPSVGASLVDAQNAIRAPSNATPSVGASLVDAQNANHMRGVSLAEIIGAYKSITTVEYVRSVNLNGWQPFHGRLWQRSYYDRIIRDECELHRAREYIVNNPLKWALDSENPANHRTWANSP